MAKKWSLTEKDGYCLITNEGGATLGVASENRERIIEREGFAFKDLNGTGELDIYEDWRIPYEKRAESLAKELAIEEIAGLMLYSSHQMLSLGAGMFAAFLDDPSQIPEEMLALLGDGAPDTRKVASDLSEDQKKFLRDDWVRHVLVATIDDAKVGAKWNNNVQAFVETLGHGIPVNTSTDPRHGIATSAEFDLGSGGDVSKWPEHIGLAATFDPDLVEEFGRIASKEYRALGIATALSPQVDLASDPRWNRFSGTFGAGSQLVTDMSRAYCDGFQTSKGQAETSDGWGYESVIAMAKHWPGGGSGEGGRDAHYGYGKYAVYPGDNFEEHLLPFTEGAFKLKGQTGQSAAIMPYYTISYDIDQTNGENVGNSYSKYIITDLLRKKYGFDGVVCTDWNITHPATNIESILSGKSWGVEDLSVEDRHYKVLMAGVDQFGGNNDAKPVLAAYEKGVAEHGEAWMKERMQKSAQRLLRNIFQVGLFENPYLDAQESEKIVGNPDFVKAGFEAQLKSIVLLKNKDHTLPVPPKTKVYAPQRTTGSGFNWFGVPTEAKTIFPVNPEVFNKYFELVKTPEEADYGFAFIESPSNVGYFEGHYQPISLQYRPYTATEARGPSVAARGDNRSYKGVSVSNAYEPHLDMVLDLKKAMPDKPVVVFLSTSNPTVVAEFEPFVDAIVVDFGVQKSALFEVVSGKTEPSGLLPLIMPKDMATVDRHFEDVSFDIEPYVDSEGNSYDFAYGLNWSGPISDWRTEKYGRKIS
jgi:beta-glucosidase